MFDDDKPTAYPTTAAEWWRNFDAWKAELRALVGRYYPIGQKSPPDVRISAAKAEAACEVVRGRIAREPGPDPLVTFDEADRGRLGWTLVGLLNRAWFGMPESLEVRAEPGFFILCDLCSEAEVLTPPEAPAV